ncbi:MAG: formate dehydrogenase accessory sulfurtransferase FdhD, partial [Eggerthellaceae bacterium]|nr:formate dehydrogenase accessory sulfurtransferase FdhD [Eggerthellaceae bacterium]
MPEQPGTIDNYMKEYCVLDWSADDSVSPEEAHIISEYRILVEVEGQPAMTIMCTPGDDEDLVVGRLFTEGFIDGMDELESLTFTKLSDDSVVAHVTLANRAAELVETPVMDVPRVGAGSQVLRRFADRTSREDFLTKGELHPWLPGTVFAAAEHFAQDSPLHRMTSGAHSCYMMQDGRLIHRAEDIGRHNTVDKVIGWALRNGVDMTKTCVFISGRIPTDMIVKAIRAKFGIFATKKMPTRQAIDMARRYHVTLVCDVDKGHLKVFS